MRLLIPLVTALLVTGCVHKVPAPVTHAEAAPPPPAPKAPPPAPAAAKNATVDPAQELQALARSLALERIHFGLDEATLTPEAQATLQEVADQIRASGQTVPIEISGHADERGTSEYNLALGHRRAEAARQYLVALGVDPRLLQVTSYGDERPLAEGHDEVSWAANRRDELRVVADGSPTANSLSAK